jgi:hypothetical protein
MSRYAEDLAPMLKVLAKENANKLRLDEKVNTVNKLRFVILTAVKMLTLVLWVVTLHELVLKMKAVCSSETLVSTYKPTRLCYPDN